VKAFSDRISRIFQEAFAWLLRPHPAELAKGMRFVEEARAERLANLLRFGFSILWLATTSVYVANNPPQFNVINLGSGFLLMFIAISYHFWLSRVAYHPLNKYVLTTSDLGVSIGILAAYAAVAGPVFVLKMPIYLTVLCSVGLAALRIQRLLAIYAGVSAILMLVGFWLWMQLWYGIDYGTRMEHAFGGKVNGSYLVDTLIFLLAFASITVVAAYNIRRQVDLRIIEVERSAREEERALMAAGLAHEIRNPLSGIFGSAQLLRESSIETNPAAARYTEIIFTNVNRLRLVVDGFLDFARPFPVRPALVELNALVRDFCAEQSRLVPESPVQCVTPSEPIHLSTDPEAVLQVLLNLIQNARRYQPKGLPVRVRIERIDEKVHCMVEDKGAGVSKEMLPHLFSPFQSRSAGGTGLGLAISQKIARALGGDLNYEPLEPGARFVLTVPDISRRLT
jgi:signal transduction histidine kinase